MRDLPRRPPLVQAATSGSGGGKTRDKHSQHALHGVRKRHPYGREFGVQLVDLGFWAGGDELLVQPARGVDTLRCGDRVSFDLVPAISKDHAVAVLYGDAMPPTSGNAIHHLSGLNPGGKYL